MSSLPDDHRSLRVISELIDLLAVDLRGLAVYTESASGHYAYTPVAAALAGADAVVGLTRSTGFGSAVDVRTRVANLAKAWGVSGRVRTVTEKRRGDVESADIITNSGLVRPIDREMVRWMKATAVVPLMWESWEVRPEHVDLAACRARGIAVAGTRESRPPCDMTPYSGMLAIKLLLELGLEVSGCRILLLGTQSTLAGAIHALLRSLGASVTSARSDDAGDVRYTDVSAHLLTHGSTYDAVVVAEHHDPSPLLADGGWLPPAALAAVNPAVRVAVIAGNVDQVGLDRSGLVYRPARIEPFGKMSYQPYMLGPKPVLLLYLAGLKVGQTMARVRIAGGSPADAVRAAVDQGLGMDLDGDDAWL